MKKTGLLLLGLGLIGPMDVNAQLLQRVQNRVENRLEREADKQTDKAMDRMLDGEVKEHSATSNGGASAKGGSAVSSGSGSASKGQGPFKDLPPMAYDFVQGTEVVFADDFSNETVGGMASHWTSNGTGAVEMVDGEKWLRLFDKNTYKIKDLVRIPENFTLEFDLMTRAENKNKLDVSFGFDYEKGVGEHKFLPARSPVNVRASYHFDEFTFTSKEVEPNKKSEIKANMSYFVNGTMQVKIRVDGDRMRAYIDDYKVLDTDMANPMTRKYFYIAVTNDHNAAGVYLGNFRIAKVDE